MKKIISRIIYLAVVFMLAFTNVQAAPKASNDAIWKKDISEKNFVKNVKKFHVPKGIEKKGYEKYFKKNAKVFYRISIKHKLDPKYIFALGIVESDWGTSLVSKNNLFGLGAYAWHPESIAYRYASPTAAIKHVCCILEEYSTPTTWQYETIVEGGYDPHTIEGQMSLFSVDPTQGKMVKAIIHQVFGNHHHRTRCGCCCEK